MTNFLKTRHNTVCLCGSTKFLDEFITANKELTKRGISVISISFAVEKDDTGTEKEKSIKELLDLVHFNKILRSDAIVVVGPGYIGFSTAREILWGDMQGKSLHDVNTYNDDETNLIDWDALAENIKINEPADEYYIVDKAKQVLQEKAGS